MKILTSDAGDHIFTAGHIPTLPNKIIINEITTNELSVSVPAIFALVVLGNVVKVHLIYNNSH